jgi:transcriptional regulator GlxA family with amidase domain
VKKFDAILWPKTLPDLDRRGLPLSEPVKRARIFMEDNYERSFDLDHLASIANLSKYHFARRFKSETGMTSRQYLTGLRLGRAVLLLRATRMSISEVCFAVGFGDLTHFERVFKKQFGRTPTQFRRQAI